jgi:hypothetical protein
VYFKCAKIRVANESSRAELGLVQARPMKIWVESSRAHETFWAEKLAQTRLVTIRVSSWAGSQANACALTQFDI